jgi:hypothetical protein
MLDQGDGNAPRAGICTTFPFSIVRTVTVGFGFSPNLLTL